MNILWGLLMRVMHIPRDLVCVIIRIYQKTLSPDHGFFRSLFPHGYCKFNPSCSTYAYQTIKKSGLIKGGFFAVMRIFRCNPWSEGGDDPIH